MFVVSGVDIVVAEPRGVGMGAVEVGGRPLLVPSSSGSLLDRRVSLVVPRREDVLGARRRLWGS